jgi:hypothetical protein
MLVAKAHSLILDSVNNSINRRWYILNGITNFECHYLIPSIPRIISASQISAPARAVLKLALPTLACWAPMLAVAHWISTNALVWTQDTFLVDEIYLIPAIVFIFCHKVRRALYCSFDLGLCWAKDPQSRHNFYHLRHVSPFPFHPAPPCAFPLNPSRTGQGVESKRV